MKQGPEEKTALLDPWPDEPPVIGPGHTFDTVTDKISDAVLKRPIGYGWLTGVAVAGFLTMMLLFAVTWLFIRGVGIWGIQIPSAWGFAIVNFVWWIGIGHAGTLISAILLLLKQSWRNSINRFAEAMTLFAVACAGMFPVLHLGRPWLAYWLFPYPNSMGVWPQFRSPLVWDVFAVSTYATISAVFWFVGLVPDFATMREQAQTHVGEAHLRNSLAGLARFGAPLEALRSRVSAARRIGDAAGALCTHRGELRLRNRHRSRMAHDDLPALLRRGRHLFRIRHGAGDGDSDSQVLPPGRHDHHAPSAELGEGDAGDGTDRCLWIFLRDLHRAVQRVDVREVHAAEPVVRALRGLLLAADHL